MFEMFSYSLWMSSNQIFSRSSQWKTAINKRRCEFPIFIPVCLKNAELDNEDYFLNEKKDYFITSVLLISIGE